jgi:cobyrinic acid a,c-diamide synthase
MHSICISAISSNQGKTLLCTALLWHFRKSVRPFKIGPDFIDPQFHESICKTPSVNLDTFLMNKDQVKWLFNHYSDKKISILEGVMGFYDGMDKGCSAYGVSKLLKVPTILVLDGSGSYITISAVLKGLKTYKENNTIKGVVLNKLSSKMHFELIKKQILSDFDDILVLGWIEKNLQTLKSTHLGLDLKETDKLEDLSKEVLKHIDLKKLELISSSNSSICKEYPFKKFGKIDKKITIVKDENFSFVYHDNIEFLKEVFSRVEFINAKKDEKVSHDSDIVYLPGGYIEVDDSYKKMQNFKSSLIEHAKTKHIYAECAGLLYLSKKIDEKSMSGILDLEFRLMKKRVRLGYYLSDLGIKGHAFHYSTPTESPKGVELLSKKEDFKNSSYGSWKKGNAYGTYLHVTLRNNMEKLRGYFGI